MPAFPRAKHARLRAVSTILYSVFCCLSLFEVGHAVEQVRYVEATAHKDSFAIAQNKVVSPMYVDSSDHAGVLRAANDLCVDIERVTGVAPALETKATVTGKSVILVGTLGKSRLIDQLVQAKKIDVSALVGKWEASLVQVVTNPMPGVSSALVIVGSDKRGTIYGLYDVSEQIGVSPWNWWADVPVKQQNALFVNAGRYVADEPAVKYRGIFLNDEEPALGNWTREKFGDFNSKFYTRVYELLLRLKANYLWPAMWGKSLYEADPESARLADEYGIVIGTSHHEPMMRAQRDWGKARGGEWNYQTNEEKLRDFWREGVRRNKDYETLTTIGMRGDGDMPMMDDADAAAKLMETIVADQRKIIAEEVNPNVEKVPQLWALYKEVQDYYAKGMRVPDDVTLLWCDDNWGNLRRLPTAEERARKGGAGIYYHFDYVGGPRSYKWINTVPIAKVWEQMNLAHQYDANRIWIVNVGDLKPMEFPIEFFLDFARDPKAWPQDKLEDYTRLWAQREFGPTYAADIADIVDKYTKYNGRCKPELLNPDTFSLVDYQEADRVLADWKQIAGKAESIYAKLPPEARDAFFQLVLYPTKASAIVNELYITVGRNRLHAAQGRASTNELAAKARALFQADADLAKQYNQLGGGRWNHMMDQTHIGYTTWSDPKTNIMPETREIQVPVNAALGVVVEGSTNAYSSNSPSGASLPAFDSFNRQNHFVEVFNRGQKPFNFSVAPSAPWIVVSPSQGTVEKEQRLFVSIDWDKVPVGTQQGTLKITSSNVEGVGEVTVAVQARSAASLLKTPLEGFVESNGYVSMEAEHYTRKVDADAVKWDKIEGLGHTLSSMTVFPVTAPSVLSSQNSPRLEYSMYLFNSGRAEVETVLAPTLDFVPGRAQRFAISFDDQTPQIIELPKQNNGRLWDAAVRDGAYRLRSTHTLNTAGYHTLKVWMVDPGVVLQKLVVNMGGAKPSYLGPPESYRSQGAGTVVTINKVGANPDLKFVDAPVNNGAPSRRQFQGGAPQGGQGQPYRGNASIPVPRGDANSLLAHEQLVAKAKVGGIDLYFLGDSITRRWGTKDAQYAPMLENWKQNFFGWNAGNFGWGADSIQNILWRIQNGELEGVNPKVIVILAGTNNVGTNPGGAAKIADIVKGIEALVTTSQQKAPNAKIVLTAIFPRNDNMAVLPEIQKINEGIEKLDDGKTIFFLNVNDKLAGPDGTLFEGMMGDKLHPTVKGYQVWADGLRPLLTQLLGPPAITDHAPSPTGDPSATKPDPRT